MMDARLKTQIEELLGLRPGAVAKRAVRFSDLKNGLAGVGGGFDAAAVKRIAETVARDVAEGYDGANVDLGQLQAEIDAARAEADAARAEVINAISAANAAQAYADALVASVRSDLAADFTQAQEAATVAAQQIQTAADAVLAEAVRVQDWSAEAQTGATQATAARDLAVIARQGAQVHEAAAELAAGVAATARDQAGAQADAAATSRTQAAGFASDSSASAIASEQSRLAADVARGGAENAQAGAQAARDTSVSAKDDAEGARSQAQASANLAAQSRTDAAGFADAAGTARTQAQNSASAAAGSASTAATQATNAGSSATAANSSRIAAEAARDGANAASASAGISRDQAVTARQNAETAAAGAQESLNLTAEVSGRDMSVINDTFLLSSDWTRYQGQGSLLIQTNAMYPIGRTWRFVVGAAQNDGLQIIGNPGTIWTGQVNADAYVIEVEYDFDTGNLDGAGVRFEWRSSAGVFAVHKRFRDLTSGPYSYGRAVARAVIKRPTGYSGTFQSHNLFVMANWSGMHPDPKAKTIRFHRVRIRVATDEEVGSGEVAAGVRANLLVDYLTSAQTNQAVAALEESLTTAMGGSLAAVRRSANAIANMSGSVARIVNVATVDGQPVGAGIEAVAFNNTGGTSGTLLQLIGDNVVAKGTLSASRLVVGLGKNLLQDPEFLDGVANWSGGFDSNHTLSIQAPGTSGAHPAWPTLRLAQTGATTALSSIQYRPTTANSGQSSWGIAVKPGAWFCASAYLRNAGAGSNAARVGIIYRDAAGNVLPGNTAPSFENTGFPSLTAPDTWKRFFWISQAPANAVYAEFFAQKQSLTSGNSTMNMWKPQLEETHADATGPSPWSGSGTTYINGGRIITDTFDATRMITTPAIRAIMGRFGSLTAANISVGVGEVGTIMLNGNAVTVSASQTLASDLFGTGVNTWRQANQVTFTLPFAGSITAIWFGSHGYSIRPYPYTANDLRLVVNGNQLWTRGGELPNDYPSMGWKLQLAAGTHTIRIDWRGENNTINLFARTLIVDGTMR